MAVDLSDYVETLKREVTPVGSTMYSGVSDTFWTGAMADAFWDARLDGLIQGYTCDEDGIVTPEANGGEEFPRTLISVVALYAGIRVLRNQILNMGSASFKAGPVEYERQVSATMLTEMLKQLRSTKDRLLDDFEYTSALMVDGFSVRSMVPESYYGSAELI